MLAPCLWSLFEAICWYGHQGGFREGALSPRQASPESGTALGIDTLDLLGDRALKLSDLPDHCRCYKGRGYVNAAAYNRSPWGGRRGLCATSEGRFSVPFMCYLCKPLRNRGLVTEGFDRTPRIPAERTFFKGKLPFLK